MSDGKQLVFTLVSVQNLKVAAVRGRWGCPWEGGRANIVAGEEEEGGVGEVGADGSQLFSISCCRNKCKITGFFLCVFACKKGLMAKKAFLSKYIYNFFVARSLGDKKACLNKKACWEKSGRFLFLLAKRSLAKIR